MRDRSDRRYDLKQRRTSEEAVEAVGEQLASADWAADAVIEADGRTRSGKLGFEQADGRLMELSSSPPPPRRRTRRCRCSWRGGWQSGPSRRCVCARSGTEAVLTHSSPAFARAGGGEVAAAAGATHPSSPRPGRQDGRRRDKWFATRRAAGRRRTHTREVRRTCGPLAVDARQEPLLGASRVGQNLHELNDEFAIFKALPSEQDRVAATRLPPRARAQVGEGGGSLFHLACGQV